MLLLPLAALVFALTGGGWLAYHFTSPNSNLQFSIDAPIQQVRIRGITQLSDAAETKLFEQDWQNFNLVRANTLMNKILTAYKQEALPKPQINLELGGINSGSIQVEVYEGQFIEPSAPPIDFKPEKPATPIAQIVLSSGNTAQVNSHEVSNTLVIPDPLTDVWMWLDEFTQPLPEPSLVSKPLPKAPPKQLIKPTAIKPQDKTKSKQTKRSGPVGNFFDGIDSRAAAAVFDRSQIAADNELFLELQVDGKRRLDLFLALLNEQEEVLLPLNDIMQGFGFPIAVNLDNATAEGWFVREENHFYLDVGRQKLEIGRQPRPFPQEQLVVTEEDIYVPLALMAEWFPFKLEVAYNDLILYATSTLTLPEKAASARRKIWADLKKAQAARVTNASVSATVLPYGKFYLPSARLSFSSGFSREETGEVLNESGVQFQSQGDILGFSTQITADGEYNQNAPNPFDLNHIRLRLNKDSPTGDLLGFLQATELELGDISGNSVPLASTQTNGRGVQFSNEPLGFVESVNTFVLRDFAPVGWDVEVYRNGNLQAFDVVNESGEYIFEDLILQPGLNVFRILLFGPQGERQERIERFNLGAGLIDKGQLYYDVQVLESGQSLFKLTDTNTPSIASSNVRLQYGLNQNISIIGGLYTGPVAGGNIAENLWNFGLRGGFGRNYSQIDWTQAESGQGLTGLYQRSFGKNTTLGIEFTDLEGSLANNAGFLQQQRLTATQQLNLLNKPLQLSLNYTRETNLNNSMTHTIDSVQATRLLGVAFNHGLSYEWREENDPRILGNLDFTKSIAEHTLRGGIAYDPDLKGWLRTARLGAQLQLFDDKQLNLNLAHDFGDSSLTTLSSGFNIPLGATNLQMNSSVTNTGAASVGLGLALNFAPTLNAAKPFKLQPKGSGFGYGSVQVRVFIDENNNQTYDESEALLENVALRNGKNGFTVKTGHNGSAVFHNLTPWQQIPLILEPESLPDIYYVSETPKQFIVAHESFSGTVDFPIIRLGEMSGTVLSQQGTVRRQIANIPVELISPDGETLETVYTEHDGYFIFQAKPLGNYTIKVGDVSELGFRATSARKISLSNAEPELSDVNLLVEQTNDKKAPELPALNKNNTTLIY